MIKSMYYLCEEYHRVAYVPAIILFILTDVSLTQNVFMIYMCPFLKSLCILRIRFTKSAYVCKIQVSSWPRGAHQQHFSRGIQHMKQWTKLDLKFCNNVSQKYLRTMKIKETIDTKWSKEPD